MAKLDRWLPHKFRRKNDKAQRAEGQQSSHERTALAPSSLSPLASVPSPFFSAPMQQLVQGFFNDPFFKDPFAHFEQMDRWFGDYSPAKFAPNVEVSDEGKSLKVTAELPGMSKDDVKIQIDDGTLVISGEKKTETESTEDEVYRTERYYGYFQRAVPLPEDVDRESADAEFKNGVLTVRIPKVESAKSKGRHIEVRG